MERRPLLEPDEPALVQRLAATLCARGPLAGIDGQAVARFVRQGTLLELAAGEPLIREGDAAGEVYLLIEGALAVKSKGDTLARIDRPGDVVGEAAALLGQKRTADVVAEGAVRAVAVPAQALKQPEFADIAAGIRGNMLRDDWVTY